MQSKPRCKSPVGVEKTIVYSQWTGMLDLIEPALQLHKYVHTMHPSMHHSPNNFSHRFLRLDGGMSVKQRQQVLSDFATQPDVTVLLLSLKAASVGLNITCACHVVLMDPWWNPAVEDQAIDRAHRIGQRRPVQVTRLVVRGTVEEKMLELQQTKREMGSSSMVGVEGASMRVAQPRMTMEEMMRLLLPSLGEGGTASQQQPSH